MIDLTATRKHVSCFSELCSSFQARLHLHLSVTRRSLALAYQFQVIRVRLIRSRVTEIIVSQKWPKIVSVASNCVSPRVSRPPVSPMREKMRVRGVSVESRSNENQLTQTKAAQITSENNESISGCPPERRRYFQNARLKSTSVRHHTRRPCRRTCFSAAYRRELGINRL